MRMTGLELEARFEMNLAGKTNLSYTEWLDKMIKACRITVLRQYKNPMCKSEIITEYIVK